MNRSDPDNWVAAGCLIGVVLIVVTLSLLRPDNRLKSSVPADKAEAAVVSAPSFDEEYHKAREECRYMEGKIDQITADKAPIN